MAKKDTKSNKKEIKKKTKIKKLFKGLKAELKKVNWPTPKQLVNNTVAVITIVLITALIVFVLDFTFEAINKNGIDKIKESVHSLNASENTTNETNTENADSTNEAQSNENNSESNTTNNVEETNTANNTENTAE